MSNFSTTIRSEQPKALMPRQAEELVYPFLVSTGDSVFLCTHGVCSALHQWVMLYNNYNQDVPLNEVEPASLQEIYDDMREGLYSEEECKFLRSINGNQGINEHIPTSGITVRADQIRWVFALTRLQPGESKDADHE